MPFSVFCPSPGKALSMLCGLSLLLFLLVRRVGAGGHPLFVAVSSTHFPSHTDEHLKGNPVAPQKSPLPPQFLLCLKGLSSVPPKLITGSASFPLSPSAMLWVPSPCPALFVLSPSDSALQHSPEDGPAICRFEGIGQEVGEGRLSLVDWRESTCLSCLSPLCLGCLPWVQSQK